MTFHIPRYATISLATMVSSLTTFIAPIAQAQVIPDRTIPTTVNSPDQRNFTIDGGARSGSNLFHSFSQFSVPTTGSAAFNNALDVQNIFARITGGNISNIDGVLSANGNANLFLLNPSGLQFGPNAQLNLGGSFLGTTASSIQFADGGEFSAVNPAPLLTMSVPIGLQMGTNPGAIQAAGGGHRLTSQQLFFPTPINPSDPIANLQVQPGKTLALIGGDIGLNGAVLRSPSGHIELGAVGSGAIVGLSPDALGWQFDYRPIANFRNLNLEQRALLDSSGNPGGSIHLQGSTIKLTDGALGLIQNQGIQTPGQLQVDAIERLELGTDEPGTDDPMALRPSGFLAMGTLGASTTAVMDVTAPQLIMKNGGVITSNHGGFGVGGAVTVRSAEYIYATGSPNGQLRNSIGSTASGSATAGNVSVTTPDLQLLNRSEILSNTSGSGAAGSIRIDAEDIRIGGVVANELGAYVGSAAIGRGNAGTVVINTRQLSVQEGARVESSSYGIGNAGDITINASESINVSGTSPLTGKNSYIASATELPLEIIRQLLGLPALPSGNAGVLSIQTPLLQITDGALVSVVNRGTGDGGRLKIEADRVVLNQGNITSSTVSGQGGNIQLDVGSLLSLRSGSQIAAEAGANGNGGNITINSKLILGMENSDLIANAVQGRGGNIVLTTEGVFGLKFRDRLTPENDITASSEFGVNGIVDVNTMGVDPATGLLELPIDIIDPHQQVAQTCDANQGSSFVVTGRGGIPNNPSQQIEADRPWQDLRTIAITTATAKNPATLLGKGSSNAPKFVHPQLEATNWQRNTHGAVELLATNPSPMTQPTQATCANVSKP
jgi:filamentous hemagglutinin family protein